MCVDGGAHKNIWEAKNSRPDINVNNTSPRNRATTQQLTSIYFYYLGRITHVKYFTEVDFHLSIVPPTPTV